MVTVSVLKFQSEVYIYARQSSFSWILWTQRIYQRDAYEMATIKSTYESYRKSMVNCEDEKIWNDKKYHRIKDYSEQFQKNVSYQKLNLLK